MNLSNNPNNSDLLQAQYWRQIDLQMLDAANATEAKNALEAITSLTAAHIEKAAGIRGDGDLSEAGRRSRLVALIERNDAALAKIADPLTVKLEEKVLAATRAAENAVAGAEPTVQEVLRMIEVRTICRDMDDLALGAKLIQLATDGSDDLTCKAILSAPRVAPLVTADVDARARKLMAVRLTPGQTSELEQSRDTLAILGNAVATATNSFSTPTERAALGMADGLTRRAMGVGRAMSEPAADAPGA